MSPPPIPLGHSGQTVPQLTTVWREARVKEDGERRVTGEPRRAGGWSRGRLASLPTNTIHTPGHRTKAVLTRTLYFVYSV